MKVVVAGASGFIGRILCRELAKEASVIALSRHPSKNLSSDALPEKGITHRQADLFSLKNIEEAMAEAEVGIYLVHSMMPPGRLTQGDFADLDVILADNFARAAKFRKLKRIIYLGGLIPPGPLSRHLASRLEVEWVLASRDTPVVTLRAGLIVGANGSSFTIMEKLSRRLPVMVCPKWTNTLCQPIDVEDVVKLLIAVTKDQELPPKSYEVGGPDQLSYVGMMRLTSETLGLKRRFLSVGLVSPWLSRLWVSVVTQSSRELVYPLIESLRHNMVATDTAIQDRYGIKPRSFRSSLEQALVGCDRADAKPVRSPVKSDALAQKSMAVGIATSVQRLPLKSGKGVRWLSEQYAVWLPNLLKPFIAVEIMPDGSFIFRLHPFGLLGSGITLLSLTFSPKRSDDSRQLFYISGGILLSKEASPTMGRFEFRQLPNSDEAIVAVLDFQPRLPWLIYKYTQAIAHVLIMRLFRRHLRGLAKTM